MLTLARRKADQADRVEPAAGRRPRIPGSPAQAVLDLQRTAGNRAVAGLLGGRTPVVQRYEVQDCGSGGAHPRSQVDAAHGRARTMLSIAAMESADSGDPTVRALARKYFKLTVPPVTNREKILWFGRVRQVLSGMSKGQDSTTYECEPRQTWKDGLCTPGSFAITILNIHLCPKWWSLTSIDDRAFILLHEWAHKHGPSVHQIFETYCDASGFAKEPAEDLVAEPDAYASYIYELVTGSAPTATVC
jgi:hypothetical protein